MPVILNKSKFITPRLMKEAKQMGNMEKKALQMSVEIAKQFGEQTKKTKQKKKIYFR